MMAKRIYFKRLAVLIITFVGVFGISTTASANLITNGYAELGNTNGWYTSNVDAIQAVQVAQADKPLDPVDGDYFFSFSEVGIGHSESVFMSQQGNISTHISLLTLSGYCATEFIRGDLEDFGDVRLSLYDNSDNLLSQVVSGPFRSYPTNFQWNSFEVSLEVPELASYWEIELTGTVNYGYFANVYWDAIDLSSTPVPEPTTIILLGTGLIALAGIKRGRRIIN